MTDFGLDSGAPAGGAAPPAAEAGARGLDRLRGWLAGLAQALRRRAARAEPSAAAEPVAAARGAGAPPVAGAPAGTPALVVDMDGALARTDPLHEALLAHAAADPRRLPGLLRALFSGRAGLAARLEARDGPPPPAPPLNAAVLELARAARAGGRRVALVSAAPARQVEAVAAQAGVFDEWHAGAPAGAPRAALLAARFGADGFDYAGGAHADLPVWAAAREAVTVGAGPRLRAGAERAGSRARHLSPPVRGRAGLLPYLRALRPHQWSKNLLIFAPLLAAHQVEGVGAALAAFLAFSLLASSVYLVNDMLDLAADRAHPRKRARPFASGGIPLAHGAVMVPALALAALALALAFAPPVFLAALGVYYALTFAYSFRLKRELILDVWTLSGLYTLRILAGAAATGVEVSPWMLGFSIFLFLSLAAVKRQAELTDLQASGASEAAGRAYRTDDLPVMRGLALSTGVAAVLVLALYISSPQVTALYSSPEFLWLLCALMLYWVSRMVMIAHRGRMDDDPIVFAARDGASLAVAGLCTLVVIAAATL